MGHAEELRDELKRDGASAVLRLIRDAKSEAEWVRTPTDRQEEHR